MKPRKFSSAVHGITLAAAGISFLIAGAGGATADELLDACNDDPETTAAECDCMISGAESDLTDNEYDFLVAMVTTDTEDFEVFMQIMENHGMDEVAMESMGAKMEAIEEQCQ